ncbi:MAG: vWA domain-containing protein [Atopobiaceae bacterium]
MRKETYGKIARHLYDEEEGRSSAAPQGVSSKFRKRCEDIIRAHEDLIVLFSGDMRLRLVLDQKAERFGLRPQEPSLVVPLAFFQEAPFSEDRFLYHIYEALALYPDWRAHPGSYLARQKAFLPEAQELTQALLDRTSELGLRDDKAYRPDVLLPNMQEAVLDFLDAADQWTSTLVVRLRAPRYLDPKVTNEVARMLLWEGQFPSTLHPKELAPLFGPSILQAEWFGTESLEEPQIARLLMGLTMSQERFGFVRSGLIQLAQDGSGIDERDPFVRTFLLPAWMSLMKQDIAQKKYGATVEEESEGKPGTRARRTRRHGPQMAQAQKEAALKSLKAAQDERRQAAATLIQGTPDLRPFGVTPDDQKLFCHYESLVRPARQRMRAFWHELIGEAAQEVSVRVEHTLTGQLNTHAVIDGWPSLVEAERTDNYRNLAFFDSTELQRRYRQLPRKLKVSFVVDNSGSMRSGKLEPAREALSVVLLSLDDFSRYLAEAAARAHQRIEVQTEVWHFGTHHHQVLRFADEGRRRKANQVLCVARLTGTDGSTNDGACLQEIVRATSQTESRELLLGQEVHLVFEVTDGASSFPGAAKKAADELEHKGVEIHAIEIGRADDREAQTVFSYVFGERGVYLGEHVDRLPEELMGQLRRGVTKAFLRSRRS